MIAAVFVRMLVIAWSIKYIHTKYVSSIGLTMVGEGLGHIILFVPTWWYSTKINKPLPFWWKRKESKKI
jgi:hypothetical protein